MRVLITDHDFDDMTEERVVFDRAGIQLDVAELGDPDAIGRAAATADGLLVQAAQITASVIDALERCRVITRLGVGFDNIDIPAATRRGIVVCNIPDYCTTEVADHAMALLLSMARRIVAMNDEVRCGIWDVYHSSRQMTRLGKMTVGIVGIGRIGAAVAHRARAFDLRVLAFDPYLDETSIAQRGAIPAGLDQLLSESDMITIHAPLTSETRHLIGPRELELMRRDAVLVNTARGPIVDEQALIEALRAGQLAGAALDVVETEPLPADSPLRSMPNVILTPHAAFYSVQSYADLHRLAAQTIVDVLQDQRPRSVVNAEVLSTRD
jgi:D-3-phosphoglycerate dehydrogenase